MKSDFLVKRFKRLIGLLIISGFFNIVFLGTSMYFFFREVPIPSIPSIKKQAIAAAEITNQEMLFHMKKLSFRQLFELLSDKEIVEEGYLKRDLALGCLVTDHFFNIEKALPDQNIQKRRFVFSEGREEITLIAGLEDHHFEGIIHYALSEKWPLTSEGVFFLLKKWKKPRDKSLEMAFLVTDEFYIISTLFKQNDVEIKDSEILDLICDLSFTAVHNFVVDQKKTVDFSRERRLQFLLRALEENSKTAATLLLKTDFIYVMKRLTNEKVLKVLALCDTQTEEVEQFCIELIKSNRADIIWQKAAEKLYSFTNMKKPEHFEKTEVLKQFIFSDKLKDGGQKEEVSSQTDLLQIIEEDLQSDVHIVKENENLWKIARKYRVDIDELMRVNNLEKEVIFPGEKLIIPEDR